MIIKLNNKSENFYNYLGRFFGSRIVYFTTKDRIYDDNDKDWYIYLDNGHVTSFISISKEKIKNIYSTNSKHLSLLLQNILKIEKIKPCNVTNIYLDIYKECGLNIDKKEHKNFVKIWSNNNE